MSIVSQRTVPSSPAASWGIALAAGSLLLIGGGTLIWSCRDQPAPYPQPATSAPADGIVADRAAPAGELIVARRELPMPPTGVGLYSINYTVENGTRVVKIKVAPDGDELIVDAVTGRLIEARPSRPTAPPPMGRFAAPFDPMT
jgi:hypothetical protein